VGGNPPYKIPAGEVRKFPRFLAEHALKHLIDKLITKEGKSVSNQELRRDFMERIVVQEETFERATEKSEQEQLAEDIEAMNKPSQLDMILKKKREEKEKKEKVVEPEKEKVEEEKFAGLERKKPEPKKEVRSMPTRREIYEYGERKLNMVIYGDEKTKKKLDKMNVPTLLIEVGDPREALK
jgi:hypothetical protein